MDFLKEFDRQVQSLIQKGYPKIAGMPEADFISLLIPLKAKLQNLSLVETDIEKGSLPFVIVVKNSLAPVNQSMSLVEKNKKVGIVKLFPLKPDDFQVIPEVSIPNSDTYLLINIDRGKDNINLPPIQAKEIIEKNGYSPLTIDEGIAIVTHFPEFLIKNNCFSLLASRHTGDQRVPAIWINASKNPNLGWCWNGNPHTWLGSASCQNRIGV